MFRFARPEYLYLLLLIPVLIGFFYYSLIIKNKRLRKLGEKSLLKNLMLTASHWRPRVKFYAVLVAIILCIFALAGPQFGTKLEKVKRQGIEMMVAVDVSNSMLAQDVSPDRMSRAKQVLSRLIDNLQDDKVGLLVFAGDAYVQMPMTTDVGSAKMFLSNINPGMVPVQGTAIGSAIRMSMGLFSTQENISRSIIIITDGENHEDDAVSTAKMAFENGVTVNVLGLGTPQGSPIPINGTNSFRKDSDGNVVVTKLNEQMCQEIAQAGGGVYVRADIAGTAVRLLSKELNKLDKADIEAEVYTNYNEQYAPLLWLALIFLLVEACLLERKNPLFKNVKLF
ncbi:MAG: VWA domain-containing protein [Paludibacteraceae bacterium]|jgi:Ca-activated chloride channel homolog|nr:VWA domain-containing protein [Paludibacteraceae bacterium]OQA45584.1 MAG: von Willebrand factor type A domain protein [Bacteroidetes bacterium ADurb.Bin302]HOH96265.1 VWA domain-containing protein [Candidatus Enterocola sp.]HPG55767.1 VWA domain-containing protein [Candidatus Enterocola sp.]